MDIGNILRLAGKRALREVPMGGVVMDLVELTIGDKLERDRVTGEEVEQRLAILPLEKRMELMTKTFDSDFAQFETIKQLKSKLEETEEKPHLQKVGLAVVLLTCVLSVVLCGIAVHAYLFNGVVPSIDVIVVILGIPGMALATYAGIDTPQLRKYLVNTLVKQAIAKK